MSQLNVATQCGSVHLFMIPALDTDLKSDFQLFGDSGWYHFGSSKKRDCNAYRVIHGVNSFPPYLLIGLTDT